MCAFATIGLSLLSVAPGAGFSATTEKQVSDIIKGMNVAYAEVEGYQAETEVKVFREGQEVETERFLYTFKKPNHIRIDMESPSSGTVLIYPDEKGKVFVKPSGIIGFLRLHLSPDSTLLKASEGQRIDQTDLGLLIRNMAHSLTDWRRGEVKISKHEGMVILDVLSEDHFLRDVLTRYEFYVDEKLRLPVEVREFTPEGILKREVVFRNLETMISIPDSLFHMEREMPANGRSNR